MSCDNCQDCRDFAKRTELALVELEYARTRLEIGGAATYIEIERSADNVDEAIAYLRGVLVVTPTPSAGKPPSKFCEDAGTGECTQDHDATETTCTLKTSGAVEGPAQDRNGETPPPPRSYEPAGRPGDPGEGVGRPTPRTSEAPKDDWDANNTASGPAHPLDGGGPRSGCNCRWCEDQRAQRTTEAVRHWSDEVCAIAHALGIEYAPDTGPTHPGPLKDMLRAIAELQEHSRLWIDREACTDYPRIDLGEARSDLEYLRATASGNDYVNEHELRRCYERVDDALDALEARSETARPTGAQHVAAKALAFCQAAVGDYNSAAAKSAFNALVAEVCAVEDEEWPTPTGSVAEDG